MTLPSLLWLFPIVFMIHDFEEIIFIKPWVQKNWGDLERSAPDKALRAIRHTANLSTAAFALAVAEEFVVLSALTLLAVENGWYSFWAGMLLGFFLHLMVHVVQAIVMRRYTPALATSLLASVYCIYALWVVSGAQLLDWERVAITTTLFVPALVANLAFALWLAGRFDRRLQQT